MDIVAFDIETATITPEHEDPHKFRPLGICVAATMIRGRAETSKPTEVWTDIWTETKVWTDILTKDYPSEELYAPKLDRTRAQALVDHLNDCLRDGIVPVTWNGLGFDFDILAEECQDDHYAKMCADIALRHIDMAFQMLCEKGYMIGMQAAALGLGLPGKSEGMHGDLAPKLWAEGFEGQQKVIQYVSQDVRTTADILSTALARGEIRWTSKSGRIQHWPVNRWLTVEECLKLPLPDTSWMTEPRSRESCYRWITKLKGEQWITKMCNA